MTNYFSDSIFLWIDREHPERGTQRLSSVEDSIAALFRGDVNDYSSDGAGKLRPVWRTALHHLWRAKSDCLPASVVCAHYSMRQLAHAVGIVAPRDGSLRPFPTHVAGFVR
jgi:hypothetical protein